MTDAMHPSKVPMKATRDNFKRTPSEEGVEDTRVFLGPSAMVASVCYGRRAVAAHGAVASAAFGHLDFPALPSPVAWRNVKQHWR